MSQLPAIPNEWDQFPGEYPGDYSLFLRYLELGVARSVASVQRSSPGYSYSYVLALSRAWLWTERAEMYDASVMAARKDAFVRLEAEKMQRWQHDQLEIADLATQLIRMAIVADLKRVADGERISGTTLTQLMDRVHKWLQISTGGDTDRIAATVDWSKLGEAERTTLQSEAVRQALEAIAKQ